MTVIDHAQAATHATTDAHAPRFDLYRDIHKAVRAAMCDTLVRVGRTDAADAAETTTAVAAVRALCDLCRAHLDKENRYVHPAIEARAAGTSVRIAGEHVEHLQAIADLEEEASAVEASSGFVRARAVLQLYRQLSVFVAENFEHMMFEETVHNAALWAHYSDAELQALEAAIIASVEPPEMIGILRWMVPSIDAASRAGLFAGMRQAMPPEAFDGIRSTSRAWLSDRDVAKLDATLAAG